MIFSGVDCMKGHKIRPEMDVISLEINLAPDSTHLNMADQAIFLMLRW